MPYLFAAFINTSILIVLFCNQPRLFHATGVIQYSKMEFQITIEPASRVPQMQKELPEKAAPENAELMKQSLINLTSADGTC